MAKKTNFEVNGKKYYRVSRTIGKKSDGSPIRKTFYGSGLNEANEKADEYVKNLKSGLSFEVESKTISQIMTIWLFDFLHNSDRIKPSTFQRYEGIYRNYIKKSSIAGYTLKEVDIMKLQLYFNELAKTKTTSQLENINKVLKVFFNWCVNNNYILNNPTNKVSLKGNKSDKIIKKNKSVEMLSENEIKIIKEYIKNTNFELLILLDFATGLRLGELLALDWNCINLDKKYLKVERSVKEVYIYDDEDTKHIETIFQAPKTENSIRIVPIPNSIIKMLEKILVKDGLLFHDSSNRPLKGKNVVYQWKKILKENNIPHKKFHAIRHTYASMLLKNGVDIETVAELMGHSAISITQIYLHSSSTQKLDSVNKINYLFEN